MINATQRTFVIVTLTSLRLEPAARIAASTSFRLIFDTWLLCSKSLLPNGPPALLVNATSSVLLSQMGASCANANVGSDLTERIDGVLPKIARKDWSKTWNTGGVAFVGLRKSLNVLFRKGNFEPRTLSVRWLMTWRAIASKSICRHMLMNQELDLPQSAEARKEPEQRLPASYC